MDNSIIWLVVLFVGYKILKRWGLNILAGCLILLAFLSVVGSCAAGLLGM